jgi:hypothetical protein
MIGMIAMFKSVETLDARRHGGLRYRGVPGYEFARQVTSAPLAASEVVQVARDFPVVFAGDGKLLPVALLAVQGGENPFVGEDASWRADYIPAHIRRYPFVLGETGDDGRFVVMIDREASQFAANGSAGEPLFSQDAQAPEGGIVERARTFLSRFHGELSRTEQMLQPLQDHGLLVERQFNITRNSQQEVAVRGFRLVDMEKLLQLEDPVLAQWVRSGLMALVHAHVASLGNAQRLLRRQEGAASQVAPAAAPAAG